MKICRKQQTIERKNSEICVVTEFPIEDSDLDFAIVKVNGRYPEKHSAVNRRSKEIAYVHEGSGKVCVNGEECLLQAGDTILIESNEKFYWDGNFTLFISCNPAFTVEQHQHVEL